jgi:hypothetical protein
MHIHGSDVTRTGSSTRRYHVGEEAASRSLLAPLTSVVIPGQGLQSTVQHAALAVELTAIESITMRMEGIDALELHFAGSHQPRPLANQA